MRGKGSVFLRGKVWHIRYYRAGKPFQESSGKKKKSDAIALLASRMGSIANNEPLALRSNKTLVSELLDDLLIYFRNHQLKSTEILEMKLPHIKRRIGHLKANDFSSADVNQYASDRIAAGVKGSTINREYGYLTRCFKLGRKAGKTTNKLDFIEKFDERSCIRSGFFEEHEYQTIRKYLPGYIAVLCDVARITGMRRGELLNLKWGQVNFKTGRIDLAAIDTKAKTARFFPLIAELREILQAHRKQTDNLEGLKKIKVLYVFHRSGKAIRDFRSSWETACKKAFKETKDAKYLDKLFHDFRRTAVRNFVRKGIPEKIAMLLSGHKSRSTFERYNITSESDVLAAGKLLEGKTTVIEEDEQNSYSLATIG